MKHILTLYLLTVSALFSAVVAVAPDGTGIANPGFRVAVLNGSGVSEEELGYLDGVLAPIQAQIDDKVVQGDFDSAIGLKVDLTALSTTGGANKVPKLDSNGDFRTTPINGNSGFTPPPIRVAARQRIAFERYDGTPGYGAIWLFPDHSPSGLGASHHEMIYESGRHCFYWDDGFQLGNADTARGNRFIYLRNLGTASVGDPTRESVPVWMDGQFYNGGSPVMSKIGMQWVPTGDHAGELVFGISGSAYMDGSNNNKIKSLGGVILPFSIKETGPVINSGKVLTFGDGSTLGSAPNLQARTGNAVLVAGTRTVADTSVTALTNVFLTRRTPGGTVGDLSYSTTPGTGFTINSASASDTSTISYRLDEALTAATAPTISGTNAVSDTLTVSSGVGGGSTFQWYSSGSAVSGQTSSTYVVRYQDIGLAITCKETKSGTTLESNAITAWKPADESGYFADFRADLGTLTTGGGAATNGQPVETWQDQSGNSRHLAALATANAPLLDTSGTGGRPVHLNFDGTNDYLHKVVAITRPQTVFVVAEAKTETANERYFSTGDSGTRMTVDLGATTLDVKNNGASTSGDQMTLNVRRIITARTTSTVNGIRIDANSEVTATETTGDGFGLFVSGTSAGGAADQRHYALLVYTADLDSSAQARVRAYLKAKWGTP